MKHRHAPTPRPTDTTASTTRTRGVRARCRAGLLLAAALAIAACSGSGDSGEPGDLTGPVATPSGSGVSEQVSDGGGAAPSETSETSETSDASERSETKATPTSDAAPTTIEPPEPPRFDWTRISDDSFDPGPRGGYFASIDVVGDGRFVITGHTYRPSGVAQPQSWQSTDGDQWERLPLPVGRNGGFSSSTVRLGDGLFVAGTKHGRDGALAWRVGPGGAPTRLPDPERDGVDSWAATAVQEYAGGVLLWGVLRQDDRPDRGAAIFAMRSADGREWRDAAELNVVLERHDARAVVAAESGPAGAVAVLETDGDDILIVTNTGSGWQATTLGSATAAIEDVEVTDEITLLGGVVTDGVRSPATFHRAGGGEWRPTLVTDVVLDERHVNFNSGGESLTGSHLDGRIVTGYWNAASVVTTRGDDGRLHEIPFPAHIATSLQLRIAGVAESNGAVLAIAGNRPVVMRLDSGVVRHVPHRSFPPESAALSQADPSPVASGDVVHIAGRIWRTPATLELQAAQWVIWTVGPRGGVRASRGPRDASGDLIVADLTTTRDGTPHAVGYEAYIPAHAESDTVIDPHEWTFDGREFGNLRAAWPRQTLRFDNVADTGDALVAGATLFDDERRVQVAFYRRMLRGRWRQETAPPRDNDVSARTSADLRGMCALPGGGAVQFVNYHADRLHTRTYVTLDGRTWERYAPGPLNGERVIVTGCVEAGDRVLVRGRVRGEAAIWATRDGRQFRRLDLPGNLRWISSMDVDDDGGIWVLSTRNRIFELGPNGGHRETTKIPDDVLSSPAGPEALHEIVVTSRRVVLVGTWENGLGVWASSRPDDA